MQDGRQHLHHGGCLSGARSPRQDNQTPIEQSDHGIALLLIQACLEPPLPCRSAGFLSHWVLHRLCRQAQQIREAVLQLLVPAPPSQPITVLHDGRLGIGIQCIGVDQPSTAFQGVKNPLRPMLVVEAFRWLLGKIHRQFAPLEGIG